MHILIAGGGSSGFITAEYFMREGHDVTVIERSPGIVRMLQDRLDINVVQGLVTDVEILKTAGIAETKLFLAMTESDETNIIACGLAKQFEVPLKIARINQRYFLTKETEHFLKILGVDEVVDGEQALVSEVEKLVQFPGATDIKQFMDQEFTVGIFSFSRNSEFYGQPLKSIAMKCPVIPMGYSKVGRFQPYDENVMINEFVYVYYACETKYLSELHKSLFPHVKPIKRAMISGGGYKSSETNIGLATMLKNQGVNDITLVVEGKEEAERINALGNFPVVMGDPSSPFFDKAENLTEQDLFVGLSNNFDKNLFACSVAYHHRVPYTISLVRYPEHANFISTIPLTAFLNPALIVANKIMKYHKLETIVSRVVLNYEQLECIEFVIDAESKLMNKKIKELPLERSQVLAVRRGTHFMELSDEIRLQSKDRILLMIVEQEKDVVKSLL